MSSYWFKVYSIVPYSYTLVSETKPSDLLYRPWVLSYWKMNLFICRKKIIRQTISVNPGTLSSVKTVYFWELNDATVLRLGLAFGSIPYSYVQHNTPIYFTFFHPIETLFWDEKVITVSVGTYIRHHNVRMLRDCAFIVCYRPIITLFNWVIDYFLRDDKMSHIVVLCVLNRNRTYTYFTTWVAVPPTAALLSVSSQLIMISEV